MSIDRGQSITIPSVLANGFSADELIADATAAKDAAASSAADSAASALESSDKLPLAGGTLTGNLSLGTNVKAQFGAGNDLQIWHDGLNSIIKDTGTGNLRIRGTSLALEDSGGNRFLYCDDEGTAGTVTLYHAGDANPKLATTSTGIDVTGSVTCDGLTSDRTGTGGAPATSGTTQTYGAARLGTSDWNGVLDIGSNGANGSWIQSTDKSNLALNYSLLLNPNGGNVGIGGDVKVNTGNLVIGTSGKGIDFSAVSDGTRSVSSNVLDDYEEGTWTATISDEYGTTSTSSATGYYVKVGELVHATTTMADFDTTGLELTDQLRISLPYPCKNQATTTYYQGSCAGNYIDSGGKQITSWCSDNVAFGRIRAHNISNGAGFFLKVNAINGSSSDLFITFIYPAT
jgi:hypothetical protein